MKNNFPNFCHDSTKNLDWDMNERKKIGFEMGLFFCFGEKRYPLLLIGVEMGCLRRMTDFIVANKINRRFAV